MPSGKYLSIEQKQLAIKLLKQGLTRKQIATQLRVSLSTVSKIWEQNRGGNNE